MITSYTKEDVLKIREIKDKFATDRGYSNYVEYVLDMSSNETNLKQLHLNEECILRLIMNEFATTKNLHEALFHKVERFVHRINIKLDDIYMNEQAFFTVNGEDTFSADLIDKTNL